MASCAQENAHVEGRKSVSKITGKHPLSIDSRSWEELALDRTAWRGQTNAGIKVFEKRKIMLKNQKRLERKENLTIPSLYNQAQLHPCSQCDRLFRARIGLISHVRTHSKPD